MSRSIKNLLSPPMADDLDSNNLLLTIQYLFLSEMIPLEGFNSMYLAAVLLLSFCCDAPFRVLIGNQQLSCPDSVGILQQGNAGRQSGIQQIRTNR